MKLNVLVDTSIWVEYFNKPDSEAGQLVEDLLRDQRVVGAGTVLTELLQGAKAKKEFDSILQGMLALPFLETTLDTWIEAGRISYELRKKGVTVPTTDVVIASLAQENNCMIFTLDHHFNQIPGINLYRRD